MNEEKTEFDKLSDSYFDQPFESRTVDTVLDFLSRTLLVVQANPRYIDEFENINLQLQHAVNIPASREGYKFLQDVQNELLGYEDLKAVLGSEEKANEAMSDWCKYIAEVISKVKTHDF